MISADRLPVEVWRQVAEDLRRPLPITRNCNWSDLHQHDLTVLMRVNRQSYLGTGPVLYRCAVVKDLPTFTYGLSSPAAHHDSDHDPQGTPGSRSLSAETSKDRLMPHLRELHLVHIHRARAWLYGGESVEEAIDIETSVRHDDTEVFELYEAILSALQSLVAHASAMALSKLTVGAYGEQENAGLLTSLRYRSKRFRELVGFVHDAFGDFVRRAQPRTVCQHRRVFACLLPGADLDYNWNRHNRPYILSSMDQMYTEHTSNRHGSPFNGYGRLPIVGGKVRMHPIDIPRMMYCSKSDNASEHSVEVAERDFEQHIDRVCDAMATESLDAGRTMRDRTEIEFVWENRRENGGWRDGVVEQYVDEEARQEMLDKGFARLAGSSESTVLEWKDRCHVWASVASSPWGACGCPTELGAYQARRHD